MQLGLWIKCHTPIALWFDDLAIVALCGEVLMHLAEEGESRRNK